ncbi:H-NS histone family protein [Corticibacter populi]|uniref:H-NS histone family protein n=1 Tax=Corticibacter populi TaxID=1550736 RepID=A0A3M6QS94_9BURK|nr:H-NS histone family protein [Corticibacter populi]RMX05905.1 H-NS histone family protein [Corticibacter populi]RZS30775.1 DNA-binding protein H-NS [Corticibacter populi]
MSQLNELLLQRQQLDQQINELRQQERADALATIHKLVQQFELTAQDIFGGKSASRVSAGASKKVAAKYLNKETGETWTGRGKPPRWIQGQDREKFLIG